MSLLPALPNSWTFILSTRFFMLLSSRGTLDPQDEKQSDHVLFTSRTKSYLGLSWSGLWLFRVCVCAILTSLFWSIVCFSSPFPTQLSFLIIISNVNTFMSPHKPPLNGCWRALFQMSFQDTTFLHCSLTSSMMFLVCALLPSPC